MPKEFDKLNKKLKGKKGVDNPFALARHILGSDKEIEAKRRSKYDRKSGRSRKGS